MQYSAVRSPSQPVDRSAGYLEAQTQNTAAPTSAEITAGQNTPASQIQNTPASAPANKNTYLSDALKNDLPAVPVTRDWDLTKSVGIPKAEKGLLQETITDAYKKANLKEASNLDGFANLEFASSGLGGAESGTLTERLLDAGDATNTMNAASVNEFNINSAANQNMFNAQQQLNNLQYSNVTDALRGDRLTAGRMGQGSSDGVSGRMLAQAEMGAARDYANLGAGANVEMAQRNLANAQRLGAGQTANTQILANEQARNNQAGVAENTANRYFDLVDRKESQKFQIINELANTIGATQEETLPAVTVAEQWLEQQQLEGKIAELNEQERRDAIIESARTLLDNPSIMDAISSQIDDSALMLGEEFSAEESLMANRISNLKNIPQLEENIIAQMGESQFNLYKEKFKGIRGIYEAALAAQLIDANGYYIPANSYASDAVGDSTSANLDTINEDEGTAGSLLNKGISYLSDKIGDSFNDMLNDSSDDDNATAVK